MTLRNKTLLIIGLTLLGLFALLFLTARLILLAGFARLEAQEVRANVQRVQDALAADLVALNATAGDYAAWDDTYAFASDGNPAYVEDNLIPATFANLRLNVFVVVATDGTVRYAGTYDPAAETIGPMLPGLEAHLAPGAPLVTHSSIDDSLTGLLLLPNGPLLVASQPIVPSDGFGAIGGSLIIGRLLTAEEIARLGQITHLALRVERLDDLSGQSELSTALARLTPETRIVVVPRDEQTVVGYATLTDLAFKPVLALVVEQPRTLYREGQTTVAFFLAALIVAGLVFGLISWLLLERFVLSRLWRLSQQVHRIGDRGDASLQVVLEGQDELGEVAAAINRMLAALAAANQAVRASEAKFRKLAETSAAAIFIAQGSRTRYANTRAEVLTGYSGADLLALPFDRVVPAEIHSAPGGHTGEAYAGGPAAQREIQITSPRGSARWLEVTAGSIDYEGQPAVIATAYDITERKRAQEGLQHANQQLTTLVSQLEQHTHETGLLSKMTDLLQACPTLEESYTVIAQFFRALFPTQASALYLYRASRDLLSLAASAGDWAGQAPPATFTPEACWGLRLGRTHRLATAGAGPLCGHIPAVPAGGCLCVPIVAQGEALGVLHLRLPEPPTPEAAPAAMTEAQRLVEVVGERLALALANANLREALRHQAIRDPLTGLFNRRYMQETLEREVSRSARSQRALAILFIDLDHFKRFNDTHGHDAGDALLRALGQLLRTHLRTEDIVCRYGGEEFLLIMPETTLAATLERAEALRTDCKAVTVRHYGQVLGAVTISIGVALYPDHGATGELVIRAADQALYRAKGDGRDCVRVAESS